MIFDNESGVIGALAHNTAEETQHSIDPDHTDQKYTEYLPYSDDNCDEIVDDHFQRGEIFALENIHCHTEEGFVPNVPVHIKSIVTERTDERSGAFLDPHFNQAKNKEYPYFPTRDGTMESTDDSIVEQRCPILVDCLNKALQHPKFRAHSATCQFFSVNCLSFVPGLPASRKEGYLQEQSINYYFDYHAFLRASYFCDLCKCHDSSKWFIIKDIYMIDIRPDIHEICFPMFINDKSYMLANAKALLTAKEEVFIIDW
ncbi:unnamed protein product [Rotaria sp. Silwood1]|nr:unnamed protein product [Rotaria sp. Silwood1]